MAVVFSGLSIITQNGGGNWSDIGGGQGSSSTTAFFLSGTSSQGRKFAGQRGMEWVFPTAQNLTNKIVVIRYALNGGFAATRASGGGQIVVDNALYNVAGSDTYSAGFQVVVADLSLSPTSGSFTASSVSAVGFQVNANGGSGGDPNFYIDELLIIDNTGIVATGDTTSLIADFIAYDESFKLGVIESANGIAVSKVGLVTAPNATGITTQDEIITFEEPVYYDGSANSSAVSVTGFNSSDTDVTTVRRTTVLGYDNPVVTGTSQNRRIDLQSATSTVLDTVTFRSFDASANPVRLGSISPDDCTFSECGPVTGTGTHNRSIFRNQAEFSAIDTSSLNLLNNCIFTKPFADPGHAVELLSIGTGSMNWTCTASGYVAGSTGSPVTTSATGRETIWVNVGTGTLTINVAAGATIPSIRSGGATVNVVSGQATLTISNLIAGSDVVIKEKGTLNKLLDDQDITGTTSSYTYTYSAGTFIDIAVYAEGYVPFYINNFELGSASQTQPVSQQEDRNYIA